MNRRLLVAGLAVIVSSGVRGVAQRGSDSATGVTAGFSAERLATCQDSWLEWKDNPTRLQALAAGLQAAFQQKPGDAFFVPKTRATVAGLPVSQLFPDSIGMAVGFSVTLDAGFDATKKAIEGTLGKPLKKCETSERMRSCELDIGEKKTLMLMADDDPKSKSTLVGCYYYYGK